MKVSGIEMKKPVSVKETGWWVGVMETFGHASAGTKSNPERGELI